jgi:hypothetical protein
VIALNKHNIFAANGIAERKTIMNNNTNKAIECLHMLGEAYRNNWNNFDGRELREQLNQIAEILEGSDTTPKEFMDKNDIVEDEKYKGVFKWKD